MAFAGLADEGKVSDIIAYLATFSPGYAAAPAKN
jgi:cytochrome c2